jgi:hypothetical protein
MITLEELKARIAANKAKNTEEIFVSPFSAYTSYYNLTEGVDKLATFLLYYCYVQFMQKKASGDLPLKTTAFFRQLKKQFKSVRHGKQRFYLVNKELLKNITEETYFEAKIYQKRNEVPERNKPQPIRKWDRGGKWRGRNKTSKRRRVPVS